MDNRRPTSATAHAVSTRERPGPCLGELRELRACRLREVLRTQGRELKDPTQVVVQSPSGEQTLTLVPDGNRNLGPRWLIVAPCCGKARLALFWDPSGKRFGCRRCLNLRSARDRFRRNALIAPLLRLLADGLDGGRRGGAAGGRRATRNDSRSVSEAEIEASVRELMSVFGPEGLHGGPAAGLHDKGDEETER